MLELATIEVRERGRVLLARFDAPPYQLATSELAADLEALVDHAERDPSVGAVVLTGSADGLFLAHGDVLRLLGNAVARAPSSTPGPGDEALPTGRGVAATLEVMGRSGVAYVAALNGSALGGGFELALACDLRIVADRPLVLGVPEILLGIIPGAGGTQRLPRMVGTALATEMILDGRLLDAAEAVRLGVAAELLPPDALVDRAVERAARLARRSKDAVRAAKRAIYEGATLELAAGLERESELFVATAGTAAAQRGMREYVEMTAAEQRLPAYDDALRARLQDGTLIDFGPEPG